MIRRRGEWWVGEGPADLAEWLSGLEDGYPNDRVVPSRCAACGNGTFDLEVNEESEDGARRNCVSCGASAFIADSADYWDPKAAVELICECDNDTFDVAVGFALRDSGDDVRWISVGTRCTRCGTLGLAVDWKIDYGPSLHLLDQA